MTDALGGLPGRIVAVTGAAFRPSRTRIQAYCSAKHAVPGLTRQLAMELGPHGITLNSVAPGLVFTDADKHATRDAHLPERRKAAPATTALGRRGCARDIADAALFFAAGLVSGQMLPVNGGSF